VKYMTSALKCRLRDELGNAKTPQQPASQPARALCSYFS
jgi:hypothetical protein